ncbi:MAG: Gx transporter family protein [Clostridiales bacterium]|nr:Gx transporter family protein [Clostridiales bacterium]
MKNNTLNPKNLKTVQTALLCSAAIVVSFVESLFPYVLPVPGAKLGLANIITAVAIDALGFVPGLCIVISKALFALLTRGVLAGVMSFSGSALSMLVMYLFIKSKFLFGYLGIGVSGALAHNTGQFVVAYFVCGRAVIYYIPVLLITSALTGCVSGIALGILSTKLIKTMNFMKSGAKTKHT